jgi:hypothetical protein
MNPSRGCRYVATRTSDATIIAAIWPGGTMQTSFARRTTANNVGSGKVMSSNLSFALQCNRQQLLTYAFNPKYLSRISV